jgi:hypothetical protein
MRTGWIQAFIKFYKYLENVRGLQVFIGFMNEYSAFAFPKVITRNYTID